MEEGLEEKLEREIRWTTSLFESLKRLVGGFREQHVPEDEWIYFVRLAYREQGMDMPPAMKESFKRWEALMDGTRENRHLNYLFFADFSKTAQPDVKSAWKKKFREWFKITKFDEAVENLVTALADSMMRVYSKYRGEWEAYNLRKGYEAEHVQFLKSLQRRGQNNNDDDSVDDGDNIDWQQLVDENDASNISDNLPTVQGEDAHIIQELRHSLQGTRSLVDALRLLVKRLIELNVPQNKWLTFVPLAYNSQGLLIPQQMVYYVQKLIAVMEGDETDKLQGFLFFAIFWRDNVFDPETAWEDAFRDLFPDVTRGDEHVEKLVDAMADSMMKVYSTYRLMTTLTVRALHNELNPGDFAKLLHEYNVYIHGEGYSGDDPQIRAFLYSLIQKADDNNIGDVDDGSNIDWQQLVDDDVDDGSNIDWQQFAEDVEKLPKHIVRF